MCTFWMSRMLYVLWNTCRHTHTHTHTLRTKRCRRKVWRVPSQIHHHEYNSDNICNTTRSSVSMPIHSEVLYFFGHSSFRRRGFHDPKNLETPYLNTFLLCNSCWSEFLLFSKNAQTSSGVHSDSYSMGKARFLTGGKVVGAWGWALNPV